MDFIKIGDNAKIKGLTVSGNTAVSDSPITLISIGSSAEIENAIITENQSLTPEAFKAKIETEKEKVIAGLRAICQGKDIDAATMKILKDVEASSELDFVRILSNLYHLAKNISLGVMSNEISNFLHPIITGLMKK
ncbi:hypothetical protein VA599_00205 [Chromobacterium sp. TRC.1.1.SA]|uniref:Uncharacterized protein n=1 Tax=Chromobacterium indicum TaxID=3110228 RepID=A0ABV0CDE2_9NEIS